VTRIGELGTTLAIANYRSILRRNTRATSRNLTEDGILHSHSRENLRSYTSCFFFFKFEFEGLISREYLKSSFLSIGENRKAQLKNNLGIKLF
jgi:hypothetical protein